MAHIIIPVHYYSSSIGFHRERKGVGFSLISPFTADLQLSPFMLFLEVCYPSRMAFQGSVWAKESRNKQWSHAPLMGILLSAKIFNGIQANDWKCGKQHLTKGDTTLCRVLHVYLILVRCALLSWPSMTCKVLKVRNCGESPKSFQTMNTLNQRITVPCY